MGAIAGTYTLRARTGTPGNYGAWQGPASAVVPEAYTPPTALPNPTAQSLSSITYFSGTTSEVTFNFDQAYDCAQYADGTWAVVGPVTITSIAPASAANGVDVRELNKQITRWWNGAELNPGSSNANTLQGFDQRDGENSQIPYDHTKNVDPGATSANLVVAAGNYVVKSRGRASGLPETGRELMQNYAILHVVSALHTVPSFRPGILEPGAATRAVADMDLSLLSNVPAVAEQPTFNTLNSRLAAGPRVKWHTDGNGGRSLSSFAESRGQSGYAAYIANDHHEACLIANTDALTIEQKRDLMVHVVQMGLDTLSRVATGAKWTQKGALYVGHKLPAVYAATILNDTALKALCDGTADQKFAEDEGTFYVDNFDTTRTLHQDDDRPTRLNHSTLEIGWPEWGEQAVDQANRNSAAIIALYREIWDGTAQRAALAAQLLSGAKATWNYPAFFDYADRAARWIAAGYRAGFTGDFTRNLYAQSRSAGAAIWANPLPERSDPPRYVAASGNSLIVEKPSTVTPFLGGGTLQGFRVRYSADGGSTWTEPATLHASASFPITLDVGQDPANWLVQIAIVTDAGQGPWSTNQPTNVGGSTRGQVRALRLGMMPIVLEIEESNLIGWWRADVADNLVIDGSGFVTDWDAVMPGDVIGNRASSGTPTNLNAVHAGGHVVSAGAQNFRLTLPTAISGSYTILVVGKHVAPGATKSGRFNLRGASSDDRAENEMLLVDAAGDKNGPVRLKAIKNLGSATSRTYSPPIEALPGDRIVMMAKRSNTTNSAFLLVGDSPLDEDTQAIPETLSGNATMTHFTIGAWDNTTTGGSGFEFRHVLLWRRGVSTASLVDIAAELP